MIGPASSPQGAESAARATSSVLQRHIGRGLSEYQLRLQVTRWLYSSPVGNQGHEFATSSDGKERMKYICQGEFTVRTFINHLLSVFYQSKSPSYQTSSYSGQKPIKIPHLHLTTSLFCTIQALHNGIPDPSQDFPCRHLPSHQPHITPALHQRQEHCHIRRWLRHWPRNRPLIRKVRRLQYFHLRTNRKEPSPNQRETRK